MDILIESTRGFEKDLDKLSKVDKEMTVKKINECASLFPSQKQAFYKNLSLIPLPSGLNEYDSSLYLLKVSHKLRAIWSVDEDPIFGQVIFTLFRVVKSDDLDKAIRSIAESLYQENLYHERATAQVS